MSLTNEGTAKSVKAGSFTLNYHEAGEVTEVGGGLPLVMLHGGGPGASSWSNFGSCLETFAADFRTLLFDQPGFGLSDKPPVEGHYFTFAADALAAALDDLGIQRIHLLGNSLGGGTATRFTLKYPDRVGRLILMGPGGLSQNIFSPDPTEGLKRLYDFGANPTAESMEAFIRVMVVNQSLCTPELVAERLANATAPGAREAMASMGASFMNPDVFEEGMLWREAWRIRQHVLLTWGREDRVNPLDGGLIAMKTIPKAQLHVFPNCGHWAQIEAAEAFHSVSKSFLAAHVERTSK